MATSRHAKSIPALFAALAAALVCAAALVFSPAPAYAASPYENATTIDLNKSYTATLTGETSKSSCWYKFTTTSAGVLQLSTTNDQDSDSSVHVYLYESSNVQSGGPLYSKIYRASSTSFTSARIGLPSGATYYVEIMWSTSGVLQDEHTVTLNAKFTERSDWETEKNNAAETADAISLGTAVNGNNVNYTGGDYDWYKFTAPTGGRVHFAFTIENSGNDEQWDVQLYDANVKSVDSGANVTSDESPYTSKCYSVTAGKTYYVRVGNVTASSEDAGYTLKVESVETQAMYRLYNPNSGEHFYTASTEERDYLDGVGWNYEGVGWTAPTKSNTPVYRLYNPNPGPNGSGEHHYTMSATERDSLVKAGWKDEGIGWYSDDGETTTLYREYNPNAYNCNHNYTTSKEEHNKLVSLGWRDEDTAWYGV